VIRQRVIQARALQTERFKDNPKVNYNAQMTPALLRTHAVLDESSLHLLKTAMEQLNLSARAFDRILKVARTIADLESAENICAHHIAEAIQYRSLDREGWLG
jgi:magnesium chelatase family protein